MIIKAKSCDGKEHVYIVKYQYDANVANKYIKDNFNRNILVFEQTYVTKCLITEITSNKNDIIKESITYTGYSYCEAKDRYDKHIGKYISCFRALNSMDNIDIDLKLQLLYTHPHLKRIEIKKIINEILHNYK